MVISVGIYSKIAFYITTANLNYKKIYSGHVRVILKISTLKNSSLNPVHKVPIMCVSAVTGQRNGQLNLATDSSQSTEEMLFDDKRASHLCIYNFIVQFHLKMFYCLEDFAIVK